MTSQSSNLTRREFLYYVWGASMALFTAEAGGALIWFALPRSKPGEFGDIFTFDVTKLPPSGTPWHFPDSRLWLVNVNQAAAADPRHPTESSVQPGFAALYEVCTHEHCAYKWVPVNGRFECPCHGAKFLEDGTRTHGPALRDLDRFLIQAVDANGNVLAATQVGDADSDPTVGQPLTLPAGTATLRVDTGKRIKGRRRDGPNMVP